MKSSTMKENGDIHGVTLNSSRRTDDFDIKVWQQRKQQAEFKRFVFYYLPLKNTGWNDKIVVLKKTTLQLYFKTFIEKNQFR